MAGLAGVELSNFFVSLGKYKAKKQMSIQEMKSKLHQLIDSADDEPTLEQLLNTANRLLTDQSMQLATLSDLTDVQHEQLEQAIQEHKTGKTVSHEEMKQRHRKWLSK